MKITFIEDERKEIELAESVLESTSFFELTVLNDYSAIDEDILGKTDLFILDVLIGNSDDAFSHCIRLLRRLKKPFIAFTTLSKHTRLKSSSGFPAPSSRQIALEHGALAFITKRSYVSEPSTSDIQLDLAERIIAFYWSRKTR